MIICLEPTYEGLKLFFCFLTLGSLFAFGAYL